MKELVANESKAAVCRDCDVDKPGCEDCGLYRDCFATTSYRPAEGFESPQSQRYSTDSMGH